MSFTDLTTRDLQTPFNVNLVGFDNYVAAVPGSAIPPVAAEHVHLRGRRRCRSPWRSRSPSRSRSNTGIQRFRTVYRVGFYAPVVTSIVAIAIVWRFILQPDGLLNGFLALFGIQGPDWLQDPDVGAAVAHLHGGLAQHRHADGDLPRRPAGRAAASTTRRRWSTARTSFQRFGNITIPAMRPTLLFAAVITGIGFLQFFEEPYVMTQGGPLDATLSTAMYTYDQFGFGNYAFASAASYVLFLAIVVLSLIQFRLLGRKD